MSQKVLFIDRDGTIIKEPADEQIDAFEKLEFYPKVFQYLGRIAKELDFEIVMVTNQDGLGTDAFPEENFWPVHNFIIETFKTEGIEFKEQFIDRTFPKDNAPTRKPNTGLLTKYFSEEYDLANSFVIGDRLTDIELAKNLGSKGIYINDNTNLGTDEISTKSEELNKYIVLETNDWKKVYEFLKTFYVDDHRPFGVNNLYLPNTAMPHVLAGLQGMHQVEFHNSADSHGVEHKEFEKFETIKKGALSEKEYEQVVTDIVNFLAYLSEPAQLIRKDVGIRVLFFLGILGLLSYFLKKNYWQDVH